MTIDLLVLGDVNPDLVLRGGDVTPAFGQAEHLVDEARLTVGGSGAILACGAARLGLRVAIVGVVGDDLFGAFMRERLVARGVDVSGLIVDREQPTGLSVVLSGKVDRAILTSLGTIAALRAPMIDRGLLGSARHVHVSSFFLQRGLVPDIPELFASAHASGAATSIDTNWDPSGDWNIELDDLLSSVDLLMPNEMEATRLARTSDLEVAIAVLRRHVPLVVVKAGARGAVAVGPDERATVSPIEVATIDTTGAGDSFDAGFLAARLGGEPLERCLAIANACGALSTRATGGVDAQPTMQEALEAIERGARA